MLDILRGSGRIVEASDLVYKLIAAIASTFSACGALPVKAVAPRSPTHCSMQNPSPSKSELDEGFVAPGRVGRAQQGPRMIRAQGRCHRDLRRAAEPIAHDHIAASADRYEQHRLPIGPIIADQAAGDAAIPEVFQDQADADPRCYARLFSKSLSGSSLSLARAKAYTHATNKSPAPRKECSWPQTAKPKSRPRKSRWT